MSNIDGLEELVLRLDGETVVSWFEAHAQGSPDEIRLFRQWRRMHGETEAAKVDNELGRRLTLLRRLSTHIAPGIAEQRDLADATADVKGGGRPTDNW